MRVDIWSDVVCPWCYVGKRRFEAALAAFPNRDDVEVRWRSFELDPGAPRVRDVDRIDHLATKYRIPRDEAQAMERRITEVGQGVGLDFQLHRSRGGNSFDAHRLLHLAADHGVGDEMKERLLRAYFTEGEPIGDPATLTRLAVEAGLPAGEVDEVLAGDRYADAVRADERQAQAYGATGVPFFVIDETYGISGAQATEVFTNVLERAWSDTHADEAPPAPAEGCADGACAV